MMQGDVVMLVPKCLVEALPAGAVKEDEKEARGGGGHGTRMAMTVRALQAALQKLEPGVAKARAVGGTSIATLPRGHGHGAHGGNTEHAELTGRGGRQGCG